MNAGLIKLPSWLFFGLVLGSTTLAVHAVALFSNHILDNVDLRTHYQWAMQFSNALSEGVVYPRWMALANDNLGEPSFVIVHPGYYYIMAFLKALGLDLWTAMRWAATASTFMAGVIAIGLLHKRVPDWCALTTAVLLQTMPFAAFLFGFHAALPWHLSLPLAVLVIGLSTIRNQRRVDLCLAISIALLCATHLLVAFMVLVCLSAVQGFGALRDRPSCASASVVHWSGSVALGLGLSAVYWLLAATSTPLFNHWTRVDDASLNWRNSFVFPFVTSNLFGTRWAVVQWVMPIIPLAFLAVSAWVLFSQRLEQSENRCVASKLWMVGMTAFFMSSELAYPLYANIPFLTNVQWPYRFLTVSSIAGVLALALVAQGAFKDSARALTRIAIAACAVMSLALFLALQYKQYVEGAPPGLGPATMAGHVGQRGAEPASIGPDWKRYIKNGALDGYCNRAGIACATKLAESHHQIWEITAGTEQEVLLPLFAFPAWQVSVDDALVQERIDPLTGLIAVQLSPGRHTVSVHWAMLWQERVGLALSSLSLIVCVGIFLVRRHRK